MTRRVAPLAVAALIVAGCSGGGDAGDGASTTLAVSGAATTSTTVGAPVPLGTVPALELAVGQCYTAAPAPGPATSATTARAATAGPASPPVLVVDCAGAHDARVYHVTCVVPSPGGPLGAGACPGEPGTPWPGDRELRRAAVRLCLDRFADELGEPYATSDRTTVELTPTQEAWVAGARRVVCAVEA